MRITVRYFARVRELLGPSEELVLAADDPAHPVTVGDLRQWLRARSPAHDQALAADQALRMACEQRMCGPDEPLSDGCEVAFFPPVTGG